MIEWYPGQRCTGDFLAERGHPTATPIDLTGATLTARILSDAGKILATGGVVTLDAAPATGRFAVNFAPADTGNLVGPTALLSVVHTDGTEYRYPIKVGPKAVA